METITLILFLAAFACMIGSLGVIIYLIRLLRKDKREIKFIVPDDSSKIDHFSAFVQGKAANNDIADTTESPIVKLRGGGNENR